MGMLDTGKIDTVANEITVTDKEKRKILFFKTLCLFRSTVSY